MDNQSFIKNNLLPRMISLTTQRKESLVPFSEGKYLLCTPEVIQEAFVKKHHIYTDEIHPFREVFDILSGPGLVALKAPSKNTDPELDSFHKWMVPYQEDFIHYLYQGNHNNYFHIYYELSLLFLNFSLKFLFNFHDPAVAKNFLDSVFDFQLNAANKKQIASISLNEGQLNNQKEDILEKRHQAVSKILSSISQGPISSKSTKAVTKTILNAYIGTANTSFWLLYLLDQQPSWQMEILNEIKGRPLKDRKTCEHLPITEAIINETLRLYPTASMLIREAQEDNTIDEVFIEKGSTLGLCIYSLHRDPKFWDNPNKFSPQRFMDIENKHPAFFLPFGIGPRKCVGKDFTYYLLKTFITNFLSSYNIEFNKHDKFELVPQVALQAYPEPAVNLKRRS